MFEKVKRIQSIINYISIVYVTVTIITIISFFIQYGAFQGIYKLISLVINTILTIAFLNLIKEGSIGARIFIGLAFLITAIWSFYIVFFNELEGKIVGTILISIISIYYLASGVIILFAPQMNILTKYFNLYKSIPWYWSWSGRSIGYLDREFLWNYNGKVIGKVINNEIFSPKGKYIGEIYKSNGRLCFDKDKINNMIDSYEIPKDNERFENKENTSNMKLYGQLADFNF